VKPRRVLILEVASLTLMEKRTLHAIVVSVVDTLPMPVRLLLVAVVAFSQRARADSRLTEVERDIAQLVEASQAPGLAVAVIENDQLVYSQGFGFRDVARRLPVTPSTRFPIGSITKSFTAAVVGTLEGEHKLSIDEPPALRLPGLRFASDRMNTQVTIGDLLSHRSGLGAADGTYALFPANDRRRIVERLRYLAPVGEVKEGWLYSNLGYLTLGALIESTTAQSWEKAVHDRLLTPLAMSRSGTSIRELIKSDDFAVGYGRSQGATRPVLFEELTDAKPAGGLTSTALDLTHWMQVWLGRGRFRDKQVLPEAFTQQAMSLKAIDNGAPPEAGSPDVFLFGYGYGWKVNSHHGHYKVHHGGNVSGFSSQLVIFPTDHLGIVVLTNQHNSLLPYMVADLLTNRLLGLPRTAIKDYPVSVAELSLPSRERKGLNASQPPTHALTAYCGRYAHPGYGTVELALEGDGLVVRYPLASFRLEHQAYDLFTMKALTELPQNMNPEFQLSFTTDAEGTISSVSINLAATPVVFARVGSRAANP
jgi:CubicO group peptidase (beta-lactamase class C family)